MLTQSSLAQPFVFRDKDGTHHFLNEVERIYHRMDGPALELNNGTKIWYRYGMRHRVGAPAAIICDCDGADGEFWYQYGKLHRLDAPAAEYKCGDRYWHFYGMKHREDGPAVEMPRFNKTEFFLFNIPFREEEYYKELEQIASRNKGRINTNNFISRPAAYSYYAWLSGWDKEDVDGRIYDGEVVIGSPTLKENEVCRVGDFGRYYITVK